MHAWLIAAALIVLIALARWEAENRLADCAPKPAIICPNVTEERLLADDDDVHRHLGLDVVQLKLATAQVATPTAVTFVPDEESWFAPRPMQATFVNPAVIAAMQMGYADELPAGFRFGASVE